MRLSVGTLQPLGRERHLPEDGSGLYHGEGELTSIRGNPEYPDLAPLEKEEPLRAVLRSEEDLTPLKTSVRKLAVEALYLLFRERFEDIHKGEEPDPLGVRLRQR